MTEPITTTFTRRKEWLFIFLAGLFITNAVTAELISNKLVEIPIALELGDWKIGPFITIIGILPWPIVFLLTDLMNEFYGQKAVRRVSWITSILIAYCFFVVVLSLNIPAKEIPNSGLATDEQYRAVFGQAPWIIVGSISAFLLSQLLDASLFHWIKSKTGNRFIWLRSTGSTVLSQLIDSYVVLFIGFYLPGKMSFGDYMTIAPTNYILKLLIAISLTPLIYLGHALVRKYLGHAEAENKE
ncbi:MAG: queuosine precursor transporter [Flavobacteriales bacterium]